MGDGVHGNKPPVEEKQGKTKTCSCCKETKPVTEFHKNKGGRYGVRSTCKVCKNAARARWAEENPEYQANYYAENREKKLAYCSKWAKANPDKYRAYRQRRRAKKRDAAGDFTAAEWKAKLEYYGYRCRYCGINKNDTPEGWLEADHAIPLSRGGTNFISNIVPACKSCNCSKGTKTFKEYLNEKEV